MSDVKAGGHRVGPWLRQWWQRLWVRGRDAAPALGGPHAAPGGPVPEAMPSACASVVIPALNEAARIGEVVAHALADPATAEVIVIDDCSIDDTADLARRTGARVLRSSMLGKGASMRDGAQAAAHAIVVYLDGDLSGLRPGIVSDLCRPLLLGSADFVKARFGRGGGRVTELTAKPMLKVFFPELAHFAQPLGGLIAAPRALLRALEFEDGYGVDVGLLLDAIAALGPEGVAQVDLGERRHRNRDLAALSVQATEVLHTVLDRAGVDGLPDAVVLDRPAAGPARVRVGELPPPRQVPGYRRATA